jgi:hypothetical protein
MLDDSSSLIFDTEVGLVIMLLMKYFLERERTPKEFYLNNPGFQPGDRPRPNTHAPLFDTQVF